MMTTLFLTQALVAIQVAPVSNDYELSILLPKTHKGNLVPALRSNSFAMYKDNGANGALFLDKESNRRLPISDRKWVYPSKVSQARWRNALVERIRNVFSTFRVVVTPDKSVSGQHFRDTLRVEETIENLPTNGNFVDLYIDYQTGKLIGGTSRFGDIALRQTFTAKLSAAEILKREHVKFDEVSETFAWWPMLIVYPHSTQPNANRTLVKTRFVRARLGKVWTEYIFDVFGNRVDLMNSVSVGKLRKTKEKSRK